MQQAIGDVRASPFRDDRKAGNPRAVPAGAAAVAPAWRTGSLTLAAAVAGAVVSAAIFWGGRTAPPAKPVTRFQFDVGLGGALLASRQLLTLFAPDGGRVVYVANGRLMVRSMAENEPRPILVLTRPPIHSDLLSGRADRRLCQPLERTLKKVAIGGGAPVTICSLDAAMPVGMSWSGSEILFADPDKGIMRVSSNGGVPEVIVPAKTGEALSQPAMLPAVNSSS